MPTMRWAIALSTVMAMLVVAFPASSQERDSDGTRMQARHVQLESSHQDALNPPDEKADWRLIRLEEETPLTLKLDVKSEGRSARLTLTGATGTELKQKTTEEGSVTIGKTLQAGIYYIAVEAEQPLRYELSIE